MHAPDNSNITMNVLESESRASEIEKLPPTEAVLEEDTKDVLTYFQGNNTLLWFDEIPALRDTIIPQPMTLIKAFRRVISHNVRDSFKGVKFKEVRNDLLERGLLTKRSLREVYKSPLPMEKCWHFLIELGLALPLTDEGEDQIVLVPAIISDTTKALFQEKISEMEKCKDSVCVQYTFDKNRNSLRIFPHLLKKFTDNFLWGGGILRSYSQKIEKREIGITRGIQGFIKWQSGSEPKPQKYYLPFA